MKKFTIGLILFAALSFSLSWIGLNMSDAQEVEPKQAMQDNALSSLLLIGKLRLGMNKKEVDEELARVGVAPLVLPQNDVIDSWIEVPNSDLTNVGIGFKKGKVTYLGGSGKVALTEKGKVDTLLADLYKAYGDPSAVYARKYSEEGVVFEWRSESKVINVIVDPSDGNTLSVAVNRDAPVVNLMNLPQYSVERDQWAKSLMQRTFGKTFPVDYLPEKIARPQDQLVIVFNPVSASGDKEYLAFFKSYEEAWGGDSSHRFSHLCALKKDSTVEILLADTLTGHDGDYIPLSYDPESRRLLITDGTSLALLDLNSRSLTALSGLYTSDATLNTGGNSMVTSAYSQGVSTTSKDIYSVNFPALDGNGAMLKTPKNQAIARLSGDEFLPVVSPNGERLVFFHNKDLADNEGLSYGPNDPLIGELYSHPIGNIVANAEVAPPIATGLRAANRLSWFPDNKRILLTYESGNADFWTTFYAPEVVNTLTKERSTLEFKPSVNPDMPEGRLSAPLNMSVSTDGEQIIFRAFSWSGKIEDQAVSHIYVCDLNGEQLKRITPNPPFKISKFRYQSSQVNPENAWEQSSDAFMQNQDQYLSKIYKGDINSLSK